MKYKKRYDGYRSGFEATVAKSLRVPFSYEVKRYPVWVPVRGHVCKRCLGDSIIRKTTYTPDFTLKNKAGTIIETKGKWTAKNRTMLVAFLSQYPDLTFRLLFQRDNKLAKTSKTRYTELAKKLGIICAVGTVPPKEWLR
jgi:hypothetical protein